MDPDSGYNSQLQPAGTNTGRKLLLLAAGIMVLFVVLVFALTHSGGGNTKNTGGAAGGKQGSVTLMYKLPNTSGVAVSFNNKKATPAKGTTYNLDPGNYTVEIKKNGYNTFSTKFPLAAGQTVAINVDLTPAKQSTTTQISSLSQIIFLPDGFAAKATITDPPQYFYDNTWAVIKTSTPDDSILWLAVNYQPQNGGWILMSDPTQAFDTTVAAQLPPDVQNYLEQFSAIGGED